MKVGMIADIHGNLPAFEAVLNDMKDQTEQILFLGDLVGYYGFSEECARLLDSPEFISIRGNHDQVFLNAFENNQPVPEDYTRRYGSALARNMAEFSNAVGVQVKLWPLSRKLQLSSLSIAMYHGSPWDVLEGRIYPDFPDWQKFETCPEDIILLGNTHYPFVKVWKNKIISNPGSVGQPRNGGGKAHYAVLDTDLKQIELKAVSYDAASIIEDAEKYDPQNEYLVKIFQR